MIRAVIIDDERQSRNLLRTMLLDYCEGVTVIGEAGNVKSAVKLLQKVQTDLVFLDIEMSDGDGFDVLNAFTYNYLNVVFVTGYDQYAIRAIKYAALEYLLKPVHLEELQFVISKLGGNITDESDKFRFLKSNYNTRKEPLQQIVLPGREMHIIVELSDIIRIEARGSYVMIYMKDRKSHLVVNSLNYYEELLASDNFFRIHKSHLINLNKVNGFPSGRSGKVLLKDGSELPIAARRKSSFTQVIKELGKT